MNELHVGFKREVKPVAGSLFIGDDLPRKYRPLVFDPLKHSFNPLKGIDQAKAQELAEVIYSIYPEGASTLTVRKGKWELAPALFEADRLDHIKGGEEVEGIKNDLLFNPTIRNALCGKKEFEFDEKRIILARLNRNEIGDRAALIIGLFLIGHFKGQVVVPDLGFYGRDIHASLIPQDRLIAGVNYLDELKPRAPVLRQAVLLIKDKVARGATFEDAETLAKYRNLRPDFHREDNDYNKFIQAAME